MLTEGAVLNPLPDVARGVGQAKGVCRELPYWRRLFAAPFATASMAVCPYLAVLLNIMTPPIACRRAGPRRELPLGFARQAKFLAGLVGQPVGIGDSIIP